MCAVKQDGCALEYASDELKGDKEVVIEAVRRNGEVLRFAAEHLKADKEVVIEAVKRSRRALRFASDELKSDGEVARLASVFGVLDVDDGRPTTVALATRKKDLRITIVAA